MPGKRKRKQTGMTEAGERPLELDEALRGAAPKNKYYASVARRYSAARYIVLLLMMGFLLVAVMTNRDNITYENFLLLIKDVNLAAQTANRSYETITYSEDSEQTVLRYKNNVVVAGSSGVQIFSGTGKQVYDGDEHFARPFAEASDKYLLVYDFGGTRFSLYNTFTKVFSDSFEYGITGAAASDSGSFALVSRTKEYNYSVSVYSKNCNLINRYRGNEYVIDLAMSDSGDRIAIAAAEADNGHFTASLLICQPGKEDKIAKLTLNNVFPVKCAFSPDGDIVLICDREIYFYDKNGGLRASYAISGELQYVDAGEGYVAFTVADNAIQSDNTLTVLDFGGRVKQQKNIDGRIADITLTDGCVTVLTDTGLIRTDILKGDEISRSVAGYGKRLIAFSRRDVMLCTSTKAEYIDLES